MKFSTFILLGVFVLACGTSLAQDVSTVTDKVAPVIPDTTSDAPLTTSTALPTTSDKNNETTTTAPITTAPPDTTTTEPKTTTTPTTTTTLKPNTTTTTTTEAPITTSTVAPSTTTNGPTTSTPAPQPRPSHWSLTSFVGGIVFALGMVAIGFVAWKFYKARNERNYHTL